MNKNKLVKYLVITFLVLTILFITIYFILQYQAKACDPLYEIKRHNALIKASKQFLYMFITSLCLTTITFGVNLNGYLKQKNNRSKE